jgi:hypothetical protein
MARQIGVVTCGISIRLQRGIRNLCNISFPYRDKSLKHVTKWDLAVVVGQLSANSPEHSVGSTKAKPSLARKTLPPLTLSEPFQIQLDLDACPQAARLSRTALMG